MAKQLPRGLRNNNPGNIRHGKSKWVGMAAEQPDKSFVTFSEPKYGIRAIAVLLTNYGEKYGVDTVREAINRWAPPNENDTEAYIHTVARGLGVDPDEHVNVTDYTVMKALVTTIIKVECAGYEYPDAVINAGLAAANIDVPKKPIIKSRTVRGGTIAAASGGLAIVGETVKQLEPAIPLLNNMLQYVPWVVGAVVLAAGLYVIVARIQDRKSGANNA